MSRLRKLVGKSDWVDWPEWQLTDSKFARILQLCEGKEVLDCGCLGGRLDDVSEMHTTSHYQIAKVSKLCVGVDIVAEEVERRRAIGYDIRVADVETMKLGKTFDIVVAADLIEHLSNPGAFLDRAREHLRPGGLLCLVTPNPWSTNSVAKSILGVEVRVNPEHTCWYDPVTLRQLVQRHGFEPVEWYRQDYQRHPLAALAVRFRHSLSAHFILVAVSEGRLP